MVEEAGRVIMVILNHKHGKSDVQNIKRIKENQ